MDEVRTAAESDEEYGEEEYMNEEDWFEAHAEGANHWGRACLGKGCTTRSSIESCRKC